MYNDTNSTNTDYFDTCGVGCGFLIALAIIMLILQIAGIVYEILSHDDEEDRI